MNHTNTPATGKTLATDTLNYPEKKEYKVCLLGFGDNVVDIYEHTDTAYPGGNCVNFSVYAKLFGAHKSAYMGYFGNDTEAAFVMDSLKAHQIDISMCEILDGPNGYSKLSIINGDRVFGDFNEGGIRGKTPFILTDEHFNYMKQFDLIHSGNYSFTEKELPKIKEAGIAVSFDFSDDSTPDYYQKVAPNVTFAFCSMDADTQTVKEHLKFVKSLGPEIVSASRGAKGCILFDGKTFYEQEAAKAEKIIDTTGAGDSLLAAFMVGYLARTKEGMAKEEAIRESIQEASLFAAKVCTIDGAFGMGRCYSTM